MGLATAAVALAVVAGLGGCSSGGSNEGAASPPPTASTGTGTGPAASGAPSGTPTGDAPGTPSPGQSAGQSPAPGTGTTGPAPRPAPSSSAPAPSASAPTAGETLVAVTRSGGITGRIHTLIIKGDGSFLRLNAKAETVDRGKLSAAALTKLRTALREADFPRLPRVSFPDQPAADAFTYAFRHGGYEVAAAQTTLPRPLQGVLSALPPFEPR